MKHLKDKNAISIGKIHKHTKFYIHSYIKASVRLKYLVKFSNMPTIFPVTSSLFTLTRTMRVLSKQLTTRSMLFQTGPNI